MYFKEVKDKTFCEKVAETFDNFIVGLSNEDAYNACTELVADPHSRLLFLHGPNSAGKTHLISAIRNECQQKQLNLRILFLSYEEIIFKYICAIHDENTEKFRKELFEYDILLIDNIQFLVGKPSTEDELTSWITNMLKDGKTVVLASDRHSSCFERMLSNLHSSKSGRIQVIKIETPDRGVREKYLERILNERKVFLPEEIKMLIVDSYKFAIPITSFDGYIYKIQLYKEQKGAELTNDEMVKCVLCYK